MDQGDHHTPLLPIDAGIDWQWVEENWDPTATCDNNAFGDGFPVEHFTSNPALWDGQTARDVTAVAPAETLIASSPQSQHGMVQTAPPRQNGKAKGQKPRIPCSHPGCKATFPRKYELERHQSSIHECNFNVNCSVYGCSRISKPFHRLDKLREHMRRNHTNPSQFLCVFEDCRLGPFSTDELIVHLNGQHHFKNTQAKFDKTLNLIHLRGTPLEDGTTLVERSSNCPLTFLGCNSKNKAYGEWRWSPVLRDHIRAHDILERSRGYEVLKKIGEYSTYVGAATCPICQQQVCNRVGHVGGFLVHIDSHSREQRTLHAPTLYQILRPYLGWKHWGFHPLEHITNKLKVELTEAGFETDGSYKIIENDPEI